MTQLRKAKRETMNIAQTRREKRGCGGGEERARRQTLLKGDA